MALRDIHTVPPGQWLYQQLRPDGSVFKRFKSSGTFSGACKSILEVREANSFPRATIEEVSEDVQEYTCSRLGNDPRYCTPGSGPVTVTRAAARSTGGGCGGCGGRRK